MDITENLPFKELCFLHYAAKAAYTAEEVSTFFTVSLSAKLRPLGI